MELVHLEQEVSVRLLEELILDKGLIVIPTHITAKLVIIAQILVQIAHYRHAIPQM
jgi:hypothetical protein